MDLKIEKAHIRKLAPAALDWIANGIVEHQQYIFDAGIDTERRLEHFMAQCAHESDQFRTTAEYASGKAYEGRADLGNTQPGDGPRFKGHGLIQTTGRANHGAATAGIRKLVPDAPDFEADPWELTKMPWALLSAVFYWQSHNLNRLADADDIKGLTRAINGGYNGLEDRIRYRERARGLFKAPAMAEPVEPVAPPPAPAPAAEESALMALVVDWLAKEAAVERATAEAAAARRLVEEAVK